ncbi:MAG TPA: asparaginase [Blastocatellia bacterium]|jgi:L-asparaginase|nr:asparaginase [Blastocatellia bacterium]
MKKRLAIYFTGGTISMKYDPEIGAAVPALSGREILNAVPGAGEVADVEVIDFGRYPGPHMTLRLMMALSLQVRETLSRPDIDGVVITHGTDTLEETAYLLDLTTASEKPAAFVGAMRNSSELGWDGPSNLLSAMRVAVSDAARGLGVTVVMNETVLAASEATKTHTESFDSFQSPEFGPLGVVDKGEVIIRRAPRERAHLDTTEIAEPVWFIKMGAGFDSTLIDACLKAGAKGLVIEALGRGNVPPESVPGITRAIAADVPVVLASRCLRGRVYESYGYAGGGKHLHNLGVIFADFMTGQKARIKLSLGLSITSKLSEIRGLFEADGL